MNPEYLSSLSELRSEFTNTEDHLDGLRPIITSLLETMRSRQVGKNVIRVRIIKLMKEIVKRINHSRDLLEQQNESANALFEALIKNFDENKTRVTKLLQRLAHEKTLLSRRMASLTDSKNRANRITVLSESVAEIRNNQCKRIQVRNARLHVSTQKIRNVVAQIESILQERFGALKTFFVQRKMRFDEKK